MAGVEVSQGTESVPVPMAGVDVLQGTEFEPVPMVGADASRGTATDDRLKEIPQIRGMTSTQLIREVNSHTYVKPTDLKNLSAAKRETGTGKVRRFGNLVLQHTCKTVVPRPFRKEGRTAEQRLQEEGSWVKPFDEMPRTPQQWIDIKNRWAEMRDKQQAQGKFFLSGPRNLEALFQTWLLNLDIVPSAMHQTTVPVLKKRFWGKNNRVPFLKSSAAEVVKSQSYTVFENIEPELVYSRTSVNETMETDSISLQALFEQRSSVPVAENRSISLDMKPGSFIRSS